MTQQIVIGSYRVELDGDTLIIRDFEGNVLSTIANVSALSEVQFPNGASLSKAQLDAQFAAANHGAEGAQGVQSSIVNEDAGIQNGTAQPGSSGLFTPLEYTTGPEAATASGSLEDTESGISSIEAHEPAGNLSPVQINHAPTASDSDAEMAEDSSLHGRVKAQDSDGSALTYILVDAPQHGTVTLNADGTYVYKPFPNFNGTDAFSFKASDGSSESPTSKVTVTVDAVNDAPLAKDASWGTFEDGAITRPIVATDADGDALTYRVVSGPHHGSVVFNADGTFTYTPDADYNGKDSFTYVANDATIDGEPATIDLDIAAENDAPTAKDSKVATCEDQALTGSLQITDVDNRSFNYHIGTAPAHGIVVLNSDGTFTYTPNENFNGTDSFTFQATDGSGHYTTPTTVIIDVTAIDDAPVAADSARTVTEDASASGQVTAKDIDSSNLSFGIVDGPEHGTLVFNADGTYTYTPNADYFGADSFTFKANDGENDSNVAKVDLTVTNVNDKPVMAPEIHVANEDTVYNGQLHGTDADGDKITYAIVSAAAHGKLSFSASGAYTFTPSLDYAGADTFVVKAYDGKVHSDPVTITINVNNVEDAPTLQASYKAEAFEDARLSGQVMVNDADAGDILTYKLVSDPQHGTIVFNSDGTYTYTPNADYSGSDSFTFKANDGTYDSNTATVTLTVMATNDAPVAQDGSKTMSEDTSITGRVTASDPEDDVLVYGLVDGPDHGTLGLNSDGSFTYTPDADYAGDDSFLFKAYDGKEWSNIGTYGITVENLNDAPVADSSSNVVTEDSGPVFGQVSASDIDSKIASFELVTGPAHGTIVFNADGSYIYTPNADYSGGDSFTFRASDGDKFSNVAAVDLTVINVNDKPVMAPAAYTAFEDTPFGGQLTGKDVDGDKISYSIVSSVGHGTLSFSASGAYTYTPALNYNGADSFVVRPFDGKVYGDPVTITINVNNVEDAPTLLSSYKATLAEDKMLSGQVVVADADNDPLVYKLVSGPAHGSLVFNGDGTYTYTPDANYNGADSFKFKANDSIYDSNTATVSLTVTAVNDAPNAINQSVITDEGSKVSGHVTGSDVDGDALSFRLAGAPQHGTLVFSTDGSYTYTPNAGYVGEDSFQFRAQDGQADSTNGKVTITVGPAAGFMSLSFGDVLEGGSSPDGEIQSALSNDADDSTRLVDDLSDITVPPPSQPSYDDSQVPVMI